MFIDTSVRNFTPGIGKMTRFMVKEHCSGARVHLGILVIGLKARNMDGANNGVRTKVALIKAGLKTTKEQLVPPSKKTAIPSTSTATTSPPRKAQRSLVCKLQSPKPPKARTNRNKNKMGKIKRKHVAQFSENLNCNFETLNFSMQPK